MRPLKLEELTIEQKIGQLLIGRNFVPNNPENVDFIIEMVKKKAIGGIQIKPDDFGKQKIREILEVAEYPVLICNDMESGYPGIDIKHPCQMGLAATDDEELIYQNAYLVACEAKRDGFNTLWSPVLDITSGEGLSGTTRSFSDDVQKIIKFGKAAVRGYQDAHMVVGGKHYPSPVDVYEDTHMRTVPSKLTKEELLQTSILPYSEIIKEIDFSGIMTNHVAIDTIDPGVETTVSKKVISILREIGFEGVIFTDSLAMLSMVQKYGEDGCVVKAVNAGCDSILPSYRLNYKEAYDALLDAYKQGIVSEERINESAARVLAAQARTIEQPPFDDLEAKHTKVVSELVEKGLCFLDNAGVGPALSKDGKKAFILLCENTYLNGDGSVQDEIGPGASFTRKQMEKCKEEILRVFPDSEVVIISEFPHPSENERALHAACCADETVFFTFALWSAYAGSNGITERVEYLMNSCDSLAAVYHVGNPYEIKKFKNVQRVFLGHIGGDYLNYVLKALKGEFVPKGKVPVKLK